MFSYGFYDAIDNDRVYSATQFGEMFDGLITDGIYATIGNAFAVVPGLGVQVKVRSGRAWFNKRWSVNTADLPLDLTPPDLLLPRIDAVILEVDTRVFSRKNAIKAITGEPNVNPVKPTLTRADGFYQYPLAWVRVDQNVETIAPSKIENNIGKTPTPFVTGILKAITIDELWNQWEGQFDEWFSDLQAQLSGDVAVNLQNQVNALKSGKVNVSDKATTANAQNGTNDTQWMTPLKTNQHIDARLATASDVLAGTSSTKLIVPSSLIASGVAGSFFTDFGKIKSIVCDTSRTIQMPTDLKPNSSAFVVCVGGGGGGGGGQSKYISELKWWTTCGGGGGGGNLNYGFVPFINNLSVTIGVGGSGGTTSPSGSSTKATSGKSGGSTIVSNGSTSISASGGSGGSYSFYSDSGGNGGSGSSGGGGGSVSVHDGTITSGKGGNGSLFGGGGGSTGGTGGSYGENGNTSVHGVITVNPAIDFIKLLLDISKSTFSIPLKQMTDSSTVPCQGGNGYYTPFSQGGSFSTNFKYSPSGGGGGGVGSSGGGGHGRSGGGGGGGFCGAGGKAAYYVSSSSNESTNDATSGTYGGGGGGAGIMILRQNPTDTFLNATPKGGNGGNGLALIFYITK